LPNACQPALSIAAAEVVMEEPRASWHALWTRSHCERLVHDQLRRKGFSPFLPTISGWSTRAGRQHRIALPMFAGYLFLRGVLDRTRYVEAREVRGLVSILGKGWDHLASIPHAQMLDIQRLQQGGLDVVPHPYLRKGRRVRVVRGPLDGLEGILVELDSARGRLVVSLDLLQRSVAAEIDCAAVVGA
jgi:transcription antitermination factor NusG